MATQRRPLGSAASKHACSAPRPTTASQPDGGTAGPRLNQLPAAPAPAPSAAPPLPPGTFTHTPPLSRRGHVRPFGWLARLAGAGGGGPSSRGRPGSRDGQRHPVARDSGRPACLPASTSRPAWLPSERATRRRRRRPRTEGGRSGPYKCPSAGLWGGAVQSRGAPPPGLTCIAELLLAGRLIQSSDLSVVLVPFPQALPRVLD